MGIAAIAGRKASPGTESCSGQFSVHSGELVSDGYVLRALRLTEAASDALIGRSLFGPHAFIALPLYIPATKHRPLVCQLEHAWDVDAMGAGHAVSASGAGHSREGCVGIPDPRDGSQVAASQHGRLCVVSRFEILPDLLKGAHSAEQE